MKTLYLVRHAKSEWANENLADIDRPLNGRGYTDAHKMSQWLKKQMLIPEQIIASHAIRTTSTALIFARNLEYASSKIVLTDKFYETSVRSYLEVIRAAKDGYNSLMIIAHNPHITALANFLTKPFTENLPTCGIVGLRASVNQWKDVDSMSAELFLYEYPKKDAAT